MIGFVTAHRVRTVLLAGIASLVVLSGCATAVPAVSAHPVPRVYEATSVPVHANPKQLA